MKSTKWKKKKQYIKKYQPLCLHSKKERNLPIPFLPQKCCRNISFHSGKLYDRSFNNEKCLFNMITLQLDCSANRTLRTEELFLMGAQIGKLPEKEQKIQQIV